MTSNLAKYLPFLFFAEVFIDISTLSQLCLLCLRLSNLLFLILHHVGYGIGRSLSSPFNRSVYKACLISHFSYKRRTARHIDTFDVFTRNSVSTFHGPCMFSRFSPKTVTLEARGLEKKWTMSHW